MTDVIAALEALGIDTDDAIDLLAHYLIAETTTHLMAHNGRTVVDEAERLLA